MEHEGRLALEITDVVGGQGARITIDYKWICRATSEPEHLRQVITLKHQCRIMVRIVMRECEFASLGSRLTIWE